TAGSRSATGPKVPWEEKARHFVETLEKIQFAGEPNLEVDLSGDVREMASFQAKVRLDALSALSPWGQASQIQFAASIFPTSATNLSEGSLQLKVKEAHFQGSGARDFELSGHALYSHARQAPLRSDWTLRSSEIQWKTGQALACE